jgi:hypothetical protein
VDYSLLQSWLALPPGPWPPDHYTLLGIGFGQNDPGAIERMVLDRMARLRSHQLLHPELVTEGMNRLAQALVCLTDPPAKSAYDAELGVPPAPQAARLMDSPLPPSQPGVPSEPIPGFPIPTDDEPLPPDVTQVIEVPFLPGLLPPDKGIADEEVVEPVLEPLPPAFEVVPEPVIDAEVIAPPRPTWQPASRRQLYDRLARVRRLSEAWQALRPFLGDPREPLDRPARVLLFLEAVNVLRRLVDQEPRIIGDTWQPGGLVAALIRQPLLLNTLRDLLPDQRWAMSFDWRQGQLELEVEYGRLRELSRSGRKYRGRFRPQGPLRKALRWILRNPESLLIALTMAVIVAAWIGSARGR